ncbi:sacsin N-terminal ATP-binding-like domain-containing protein [Methermicoccus shengliensis]|uniref:Protein NO VEIN C-terminal domain-containing protein n=3 Tax=Methermicoccus shengliensis TaxID=660064 RepID=A0A832VXR9_9EURY|nr:MAG: hypothetical protein XD46_0318 [Euryarchaeota archaeon 55_53]KUK30869.1 MAG: hypothetical protein XD62_0011 [Methanosarcinales archeaon 56_1174]HIH70008.1 hypothetical protein [Methermicoccus shengliensis]
MDGKELIMKIQEEVKRQREIGGIWEGYCNLQKLASGDIWESATRYIYELLQNAEDAKAKEFRIYISKQRIKVVHNGDPFTEDDVRNICYAMSKKDPNETIGYLGVGFRSVFAVTDRQEIYSGEFMFRFDREECVREFGEDSLFYFYPYWIEQTVESIDLGKTTFVIPFKSEEFFDKSIEELKKLGASSLLFLRNIKNISIHNEEDGTTRTCSITQIGDLTPLLQNEDIKIGKFLLVEGGTATRFLVFRGVFQVPDNIRSDGETKRAKRGDVKSREISIAIQLDEQENLMPTKGYICSFFPIEERKINFLVHADFIVQAGRVALLDNKWNRWMMEKAREVAEAAYHYFQENPEKPEWVEQSLLIFEEREISEKYDDIFEKPLFEVTKNPKVICIEGNKCPLDEVIKITEETEELIKKGYIKCSDVEIISKEKKHLIRKDYPTGGRKVEELSVDKINTEEFIKAKIDKKKGIKFLIDFYPVYKKALEKRYAHYRQDQREGFIKNDLGRLLVIDRNGNIKKQNEVWIEPDMKIFDELKSKGIEVDETQILSEYTLIDKELWSRGKDYLPRVNKITQQMIVKKCILPKIKISSEHPSKDDILSWTYILKSYNSYPKDEIWVIDDNGQVRKSSEIFLSDKYNSIYCVQKFDLPNINYLSEEYLKLDNDPDGWKKFFENTSMKGYRKFDYEDYIKKEVLPVLKDGEKIKSLTDSIVINYTQAIVECEVDINEPIFVVLKDGSRAMSNSEIYFPNEYSPKQNWENQSIIGLKFISSEYIGSDVSKWKEFFKKIGVKEEASGEMIEEFGKNIVKKKFETEGYKVEPYGGKADLKATKEILTIFIEVRSKSSGDITDESLDSEKAKFAEEQKDNFYLARVINIPDAPYIYLLKNPANCEEIALEMKIPKSVIEKYSEKINAKDLIKGD